MGSETSWGKRCSWKPIGLYGMPPVTVCSSVAISELGNQAPPVVRLVTSRRMTRSTAELEMVMLASMQKKVVALLGMSGSCDSAFQEDVKAEEVKVHYFRMDKLRFERLDVRESSEFFWCCICFGNSDPDTLIIQIRQLMLPSFQAQPYRLRHLLSPV